MPAKTGLHDSDVDVIQCDGCHKWFNLDEIDVGVDDGGQQKQYCYGCSGIKQDVYQPEPII